MEDLEFMETVTEQAAGAILTARLSERLVQSHSRLSSAPASEARCLERLDLAAVGIGEAHGGSIEVSSQERADTSFTIKLPLPNRGR